MELYKSPEERQRLARDLAETVFEDKILMEDIGCALSRDGRTILKDTSIKEGLIEEALDSMKNDEEYTLAEIIRKLKS